MNPKHILGGVLVALGFLFRAISIAYFRHKARTPHGSDTARRRFEASRHRALLIDGGFILLGFYMLIVP